MKKSELFYTAVYIRLSREDGDKEESDSVGNQRKLLTEYVSKMENLIIYDVYVDDGYTGTSFDRPSFKRMIADIEQGKVNCVVVKDLSRFGRDYIDTGRYLERVFPELGVRFISISDGIDSVRQAYDMLLPIKNIFNEQDIFGNVEGATSYLARLYGVLPMEDFRYSFEHGFGYSGAMYRQMCCATGEAVGRDTQGFFAEPGSNMWDAAYK